MNTKFIVLLPGIIFSFVFLLLNILYTNTVIRENSPIFAAFIAIIVAIFTFQKKEIFNKRIEVFIEGSSQLIVIHMCYIIFLSTIFTTILECTGSMASIVNICLHIIPTSFILPGMFLGSLIFAFTLGTSLGVIAAFMAISLNLSHHVGLNPSLVAATIVCGSIVGENLSILSDANIISRKITGSSMIQKFLLDIKIILPALLGTIILLTYKNNLITTNMHFENLSALSWLDFIKSIPYIVAFYLGLIGLDIIIVMVSGIILALTIGICLHDFTMLTAINLLFDGFYNTKDMVNLFILVVLLSGLTAMIKHNQGFEYLIIKIKNRVTNKFHARIAIFLVITMINITIAINTLSILIAGPIATQISNDSNLDSSEAASLLNISSCVSQGLLPYTPQLLLAASMAQVSAISLLPYLYYQYFLAISLFVFIAWKKKSAQ